MKEYEIKSMSLTDFLRMIDAAGWVFWTCPNRCRGSVTWDDGGTVATCGSCGTVSRDGEVVKGGDRKGAAS